MPHLSHHLFKAYYRCRNCSGVATGRPESQRCPACGAWMGDALRVNIDALFADRQVR